MVCFHPLECYLPLDYDKEFKRHLIFSPEKIYRFKKATIRKFEDIGLMPRFHDDNFKIFDEKSRFPEIYLTKEVTDDLPNGLIIQVPCNKCIGCKLDYSRRWATRAINEAFLYDHYRNCSFLSLTFNEENLNRTNLGYSVDKAFFKSWVKRLRFAIKDKYNVEFRHMSCGEYGSKRGRPHYHMLIFGFDFPDKYIFKVNRTKYGDVINYYRSPFLESLWHLPGRTDTAGYCIIGNVTFESCAYVARYVTKKMQDKTLYGDQQPEFLSVSRMPGLGYDYCVKYLKNIFETRKVALPNGFSSPVPRYYESVCEKLDPELYYTYKSDKFNEFYKEMLRKFNEKSNPDKKRLQALEELHSMRLDKLIRTYEYS